MKQKKEKNGKGALPNLRKRLDALIRAFAKHNEEKHVAESKLQEARTELLNVQASVDPDRTTEKSRVYVVDNIETTITHVIPAPKPDLEIAKSVLNPRQFESITDTVTVIDERKLIVAHEDGTISDKQFSKILSKAPASYYKIALRKTDAQG